MPRHRALALCALIACHDAADPDVPDLPTGACGSAPHAWLSTADMGGIVAWEPVPELSLPADGIAGLVALAGFGVLDVPHGADVYRVRYRTQDRGVATEATALVALPDADGDVPSVLWLHHTTGFDDPCAPSSSGLVAAAPSIVLAGLGFAVVAPDYLGMNGFGPPSDQRHPYLVPEPTAVVSLDALRALWRFVDEGRDASVRARPTRSTVLWGLSQGGHGALWADRYAPRYLPEAELVAAVYAIPVTDLSAMMAVATTSFGGPSDGMPYALAAAADWYGGASIADVVTADYLDELERTVAGTCVTLDMPPGFDSLDDVYLPGFLAASASGGTPEPWSCFLDAAVVERSALPRENDTPGLWVTGTADEVALTAVQAGSFAALCAQGQRLEALTCDGGGHTESATATLRTQLDWVQARLAGAPLGETCVATEPIDCGL